MKDMLKIIGIAILLMLIIVGIGSCNYKLWRAEHPNAATWTFFIHSHK